MSNSTSLPFSFSPTDELIHWAGKVGDILIPWVNPIQQQLLVMANVYFPEQVSLTQEWLDSIKSPFADRLPLMNPIHVVLICLLYLTVVFLGKAFMKNFPRMEVKGLAMIHNINLVLLSGFMCVEIIRQAVAGNYSLFGNPLNSTDAGWPMAKIIWVFYASKIVEFIDTFIMVLKKNNRQISFLHVYHHVSIFAVWWLVTFSAPGGEAYFSAALNSFIHVVMYGYYFCSGLGIKAVSFIKKYITIMQMTQFTLMMIQSIYNLSLAFKPDNDKEKEYPVFLSAILFFYMQTMLALFANFFIKDRKRAALQKNTKKIN